MEMRIMPGARRIRSFQKILAREGIGAALLVYSRDVFYYTGTAQPSYLVVTPNSFVLYVRSGIEFALEEVFIDRKRVKEERRLDRVFRQVEPMIEGRRIAVEKDVLTAAQFEEVRDVFSGFEFTDAAGPVWEQRKIKDPDEIERTRKACVAIHRGHEAVLSALGDGITELELAAAVENAHRLAGHEGQVFIRKPDFVMGRGPLASGPNCLRISGVVFAVSGVGLSPAVPAGPSRRRIRKGETVIVDIPTQVEGYHADQTRTYVVGKADPRIEDTHDAIRSVADGLIRFIRPGIECRTVYRKALDLAEDLKISDRFLHFGNGRACTMIGHGVGLEVNEPPVFSAGDRTKLSAGNVMTIELHAPVGDLGMVKLEDMILIGEDKNEILNLTDRTLFEV